MISEISVKKTMPSDFEKIYPLLAAFNSPYNREDWCRIFDYRWNGTQDHVGYHLEKEGQAVGFMGLIFSSRFKNNRCYTFCNITSLIVKPEHRAATLLLLRKLKTYADVIFTCLGPIQESYRLMSTIGFQLFENSYKIIPVVNGLFFKTKKVIVYDDENIINKLDDENRRIFFDHSNLKCKSILFEFNNKTVFLIYTVGIQKYYGITVKKIHLHYISNVKIFNDKIRSILALFKKRFCFFSAIYTDSRFTCKNKYMICFQKNINPPRMRSKDFINEIGIDALYSEVVLL